MRWWIPVLGGLAVGLACGSPAAPADADDGESADDAERFDTALEPDAEPEADAAEVPAEADGEVEPSDAGGDPDAGLPTLCPDLAYGARQDELLVFRADPEVFDDRLTELRDHLAHESSHPWQELRNETTGFVNRVALRLEAGRRGLAGGMTPAEAAPLVEWLAELLLEKVGSGGTVGPWAATNDVYHPANSNAAGVLGLSLHRYGAGWPSATRGAVRRLLENASWPSRDENPGRLQNGSMALVAGKLLAGEALGAEGVGETLWLEGREALDGIVRNTRVRASREINSPSYSHFYVPPLLWLQTLTDGHFQTRAKSRLLLEFVLVVHGHLSLPGGAVLPPRSRDYARGTTDGRNDSLSALTWLLVGDAAIPREEVRAGNVFAHTAAIPDPDAYAVPCVVRSLYLDKGDGYTFWTRMEAFNAPDSSAVGGWYEFGDGRVFPWATVVLPGGVAALGASFGGFQQRWPIGSGVQLRDDAGAHAVLYHYEPHTEADVSNGWQGRGTDPDGLETPTSEYYQYERMIYHRTMITIWVPQDRTYPDTRAFLPDAAAHGGELERRDAWYCWRIGGAYLAFRPLGPVAARRGDTYVRLNGASGHVLELAPRDDYASLAAFADDIAARPFAWNGRDHVVEFAARGRDGELHPLRLVFAPEGRSTDGVARSNASVLDRGLLQSPFLAWDDEALTMDLERAGYGALHHDWRAGTVTE